MFSKSSPTFRCGMYFRCHICFSRSNETAGLKEDSQRIVLNQTPLKRGRIQRPKPNLGRTIARQKELIDEKDPEEETTGGGEAEKGVTHHRDENNDLCLQSVSFLSNCLCMLFCWVLNRNLGNQDLDTCSIICRDRLCIFIYYFRINSICSQKVSSFLHLVSVFYGVKCSQQPSTGSLAHCPTSSTGDRIGRVKAGKPGLR